MALCAQGCDAPRVFLLAQVRCVPGSRSVVHCDKDRLSPMMRTIPFPRTAFYPRSKVLFCVFRSSCKLCRFISKHCLLPTNLCEPNPSMSRGLCTCFVICHISGICDKSGRMGKFELKNGNHMGNGGTPAFVFLLHVPHAVIQHMNVCALPAYLLLLHQCNPALPVLQRFLSVGNRS